MKTRKWTNEVGISEGPVERPDIHYLFSKGITVEERRKHNIGDIWINAAVCLNCNDFIRSFNQHDYKTCSCGNIAVDGGSWYVKRVTKPGSKYIDCIEKFTNLK